MRLVARFYMSSSLSTPDDDDNRAVATISQFQQDDGDCDGDGVPQKKVEGEAEDDDNCSLVIVREVGSVQSDEGNDDVDVDVDYRARVFDAIFAPKSSDEEATEYRQTRTFRCSLCRLQLLSSM